MTSYRKAELRQLRAALTRIAYVEPPDEMWDGTPSEVLEWAGKIAREALGNRERIDTCDDCARWNAGPCPHGDVSSDFVNALTLHKQRIRQLQEALCECPHRELFQADLHDDTCPVHVVTKDEHGL